MNLLSPLTGLDSYLRRVALGPPETPVPDYWQIGDSQHYQDSARTTLATADGDPIGSATDIATTGPFHASQAVAGTRPTLVLDSGFKSHKAIRYSASQNLTHAAAPLANSRTKGTLMIAFRSDTQSPPGGSIFSTTQNQLSYLVDKASLNTAAAEYGQAPLGARRAALSTTGGQLVTLIYDGTQTGNANRLKLRRNLLQETLAFDALPISATTYAGGQGLFFAREDGGAGWAHTALEILFWREVALTSVQYDQWEAYLAAKYFTKSTSYLIVKGDSNGAGSPNNLANPWPLRVFNTLGWSGLTNSSTVGQKLTQEAGSSGAPLRDDWFAQQPYIIALGTNDLAVDHASLATLQGYVNTIVTDLTAARFPIYFCTIPRASAIAGADETTRTDFNAWLIGLAGITAIDIATALGAPTGANFEVDELHFSDAGHTVVANTVLDALT